MSPAPIPTHISDSPDAYRPAPRRGLLQTPARRRAQDWPQHYACRYLANQSLTFSQAS
jgi:hypothetical protein